jgi:hypothetical protein
MCHRCHPGVGLNTFRIIEYINYISTYIKVLRLGQRSQTENTETTGNTEHQISQPALPWDLPPRPPRGALDTSHTALLRNSTHHHESQEHGPTRSNTNIHHHSRPTHKQQPPRRANPGAGAVASYKERTGRQDITRGSSPNHRKNSAQTPPTQIPTPITTAPPRHHNRRRRGRKRGQGRHITGAIPKHKPKNEGGM